MVKLAIDKSDSRWIKQSQKGPCFKMERYPAYYDNNMTKRLEVST